MRGRSHRDNRRTVFITLYAAKRKKEKLCLLSAALPYNHGTAGESKRQQAAAADFFSAAEQAG